jgi:hypothetical protein
MSDNNGTRLNSRMSLGGTHRVGTVTASPAFLVETLGDPNGESIDDKVTMEWIFETPAGAATLYDYKWRANRRSDTVEQWSIGGHNDRVVPYVKEYLHACRVELQEQRIEKQAEEEKKKEPLKVHLWTSAGNSPNSWTKCGSGARSTRNFDSSKVTCKTCAKIAAKQKL